MAVLTVGVGSGFDYNSLSSAVAASHDGDVIQVQAGTYTNDFAQITTSITIEGVGGMVNLVATDTPLQEKGILIIGADGTTGPNVTLDNISFSGAAISDDDGGNAAGIRYQSGNLVVNNCYFFDNQDGMLADADPTGTITINNSEFADNGNANPPSTGIEHNLYVDGIQQLTIDNSYFYDPIVGHDIKSRAENTTIENSRIDDPNGTGSYEIDLPNGGNAVIENNVIEKGPGAQNPNFVAFGEENNLLADSTLTVTGNTVLNDHGDNATFVWNDTTIAADVTGNTLYGLPEAQLINGPATTPATNSFQPPSDEPPLDTSAPYQPVLPFEFACFAEGTRILTPAGQVPVEALRPGQPVIVIDAGERIARPVRWIGSRSLDLAEHPMPELVRPVRIRRDAFADGMPQRDLYLSPDHAILVEGVLIAVRLLLNGATIAQDPRPRRIRYFHVELDTHGVILAEGLPSESYLDTGNRGVFDNTAGPLILHPDFAAGQPGRIAGSCRPFVDDPARVEPIWRRLAARATRLGHRLPPTVATTGDPGLHVVVAAGLDGFESGHAVPPERIRAARILATRIQTAGVQPGPYTFVLPAGPARAWLVSRATRPCTTRPWIEDRRRLGVMVSRLTLRHGAEVEPIPLDHPCLSQGWWDLERNDTALWRWTDGSAAIDLTGKCPAVLEVVAAGGLDYPIGPNLRAKLARRTATASTSSAAA